ncbi:Ig-like domain-containing protein, partial [Marivirga lumbricoides]
WSVDTETATPTSGTLGTFNDGTSYEVVATVTDAASNSASDATNNEVSIDTTAPATPTVNALTTSDNTPVVSGTAEIGSTVVVVINGVTFTTTADASGNWSVDTETATPTAGGPFTPLTDGDYDVAVTSTDAAGNSSSDATNNELTINTSIPTAPTVNLLTTNDVTPVITGTNGLGTSQPAGETLTVTVNGATYTVTPDASGNWSVDTETATPTSGTLGTFNNGTSYEVVATVTDAASNSASDATSNEVSIDTTAPATPTVNALTTSDNTPVVSGTAEIGSTVVVVINGVTFTTTADASGDWSVDTETATPTAGGPFTPLTDGDYDVAVTSTDVAGNSSSDAT